MKEYIKIPCIYSRDPATKKLSLGNYINETVAYLANNKWDFTEKVDGTNTRVHWDGHAVTFGGRTDSANIPASLVNRLNILFGGSENEELFEQKFGETEVTLYGEGYGLKIQTGKDYIPDGVDFILFDVKIGNLYLKREAVEEIAAYFNIKPVPLIFTGTLSEGVEYVLKHPKSIVATYKRTTEDLETTPAYMEGLVGKPSVDVLDRQGRKITVKIKWADLKTFSKGS